MRARPDSGRAPTRITLLLLAIALAAAAAPTIEDPVAGELRRRLENPDVSLIGGQPLHAGLALPQFYERRLYEPAWLDAGRPSRRARALRAAITEAGLEGLDPEDYQLNRLEELAAAASRSGAAAGALAEFDLLHTDAFLVLAAHLVSGRLNPETFDPEWVAVRREVDLVTLLEGATGNDDVEGALDGLRPEAAGYHRLVAVLARYRRLAAGPGWAPIPDGPTLEPGAADPRLGFVVARLKATGDLQGPWDGGPYDRGLATAVRGFQGRHGLEPDARIGPRTREAMNFPVEMRARQIELNLERWRWLPRDLGDRYVLVNIPAFQLRVVEDSATVLDMRVIVGRPYRRTPVFSDVMRYLVLNPYWEIPLSIAVEDKLPLIRKDPTYLARQGIQVLSGWGAGERALDPAAIDWSRVASSAFPYRLRQDPGPLNALGRVKFMFPNRFNVYLHDTPSHELFSASERDFSSGCIRLDRPLDLAEYALAGKPGWGRSEIEQAVASGGTLTVALPKQLPVHLQYWTAWVEEDGTVQFRRDVYGRDSRLEQALGARRKVVAGRAATGGPPATRARASAG